MKALSQSWGRAGLVGVDAMIGRFMQTSPTAVSGLPDYFYLLRIEEMIG
jgi:hypothetical protein